MAFTLKGKKDSDIYRLPISLTKPIKIEHVEAFLSDGSNLAALLKFPSSGVNACNLRDILYKQLMENGGKAVQLSVPLDLKILGIHEATDKNGAAIAQLKVQGQHMPRGMMQAPSAKNPESLPIPGKNAIWIVSGGKATVGFVGQTFAPGSVTRSRFENAMMKKIPCFVRILGMVRGERGLSIQGSVEVGEPQYTGQNHPDLIPQISSSVDNFVDDSDDNLIDKLFDVDAA